MKHHRKHIAAHAPMMYGTPNHEHLPEGVDRAATPPVIDANAAKQALQPLKPEPPPHGCLPKFDSRYSETK